MSTWMRNERTKAFDLAAWVRTLPEARIVLKVDVEGAEYVLLPHLIAHGLMDRFSHVLVEWHTGEYANGYEDRSRDYPRGDRVPGRGMAVTLTAYSKKHGHGKYDRYFPFYDETLKGHKVERLLEIGCSSRSLTTWLECFPKAEIVGLDASAGGPTGTDDNRRLASENARLTFVLGDQADIELLESLGCVRCRRRRRRAPVLPADRELQDPLPGDDVWRLVLHRGPALLLLASLQRPSGPTTMNFIKGLLDDIHAHYLEPPREARWPINEVRLLDSVMAFRRT